MSRLLVAQRALTVPGWAKDALWRRAQAIPSLDLRFADSKSLVDAVTGASLITFTRASSGTFVDSAGVLQTAANDVPRFDHNPTTGESLGLLPEEQRTNLLLQSEDLLTTWIANDGLSRTANQVVAPNEFTTADLLASNGTLTGYLEQPNALSNQFVSGTTYSYSVYLKKANTSTCLTLLYGTTFNSGGGNPIATWNLDTGVPAFVNGATGSMTAVGNGWYRCVITDTATQTHTQNQQWLRMVSPNGDVYAWGAQLEVGAFPTSYIPTTTAAATRSADVASITGSAFSGFYRQDAFTLYADLVRGYSGNFLGFPNFASFTDGTASNNISLYGTQNNQNITNFGMQSGGVVQNDFVARPSNFPGPNLVVQALATNSSMLTLNGILTTEDISITMPVGINQFRIGSDAIGQAQWGGTIKRLCYWPQRLSNQVLQAITQ